MGQIKKTSTNQLGLHELDRKPKDFDNCHSKTHKKSKHGRTVMKTKRTPDKFGESPLSIIV